MSNHNKVTIRKMNEGDITGVAKIYEDVSINKNNYKQMLLSNKGASFSSCGGMFVTQSEDEVAQLLSKGETFYVGVDSQGIKGFLWSRLFTNDFSYYKNIDYDCKKTKEYILKEAVNKSVIHGGEVAVSPYNSYLYLATAFMYIYLIKRFNLGYKSATGEVYKVVSCEDERDKASISVFNNRSYNLQKKTGARIIGKAPLKTIKADCFQVEIEPVIVMWNLSCGIRTTEKILNRDEIVFEGVL